MKEEHITMQEILEAINESSTKIQQQFVDLEERMNERFDKVEKRLDYHETWLNRIESNMATKSQLSTLCSILVSKDTISRYDSARVANAL